VEIRLAPGRPIRLKSTRDFRHTVYAVPRAALDRMPDRAELLAALMAGRVPGVEPYVCQPTVEVPDAEPRPEVDVRVRVTRLPAGRGVAFVRVEEPGLTLTTVPSRALGETPVRWELVGITAAVALAGLGLWWVGRGKSKPTGPGRA
jgi:hypothetical protein